MLVVEFALSKPGLRTKKLVGRGPKVYTLSLGLLKIILFGPEARVYLIQNLREQIGYKQGDKT